MYVANSEPTVWQPGGGQAGVVERGLISCEPNRSWTAYGEVVRLTQGSLPVRVSNVTRDILKPNRIAEPEAGQGTEGGRFTGSTDYSGPIKLMTEWRIKP
jgi:hypothetical protein